AQLPEHEIAALAASGLTNKQIAEQLFLSPRTVSHHLRKIFPKLGSTTRAARRDGIDGRTPGVLPAEFAEPVVVDAEMVGDLVDDGPADLAGDLPLGPAGRADRPAVDGDAVRQHAGVLRGAAGERDALVQPEQAGRSRAVLDRHRDV